MSASRARRAAWTLPTIVAATMIVATLLAWRVASAGDEQRAAAIVLVMGMAFAGVTALVLRLGQVEDQRAREAEMVERLQREIERRERAEERFAQRARALERSNADLSRFAHVISHDLRAPLNAISMHLQLLAESDAANRHVASALQATARMGAMIDSLLEYSRLGGSNLDGRADASAAAAAALADLEGEIHDTGAQVAVGPLPTIAGSQEQLTRVFQNLIGNALRHRGEASPRITVTCEDRGAHWLFRVRDNGPGISPLLADGLFGLFEAYGPHAGTGIGLASCRRIIEAAGGRIWVQSRLWQGATFLFTWPHQPEPRPDPEESVLLAPAAGAVEDQSSSTGADSSESDPPSSQARNRL